MAVSLHTKMVASCNLPRLAVLYKGVEQALRHAHRVVLVHPTMMAIRRPLVKNALLVHTKEAVVNNRAHRVVPAVRRMYCASRMKVPHGRLMANLRLARAITI
jgi:hypothetical protein